jgi:transposase-like protein
MPRRGLGLTERQERRLRRLHGNKTNAAAKVALTHRALVAEVASLHRRGVPIRALAAVLGVGASTVQGWIDKATDLLL